MYAKLFTSIYQGTLRGNSHGLLVFTNLLAHCDKAGHCDMHPKAIAEEVGLTIEQVRVALDELEAPDYESRSPEENGCRIKRLDDHRAWGWLVVNYEKYRAIRDEGDRREQNRKAQEAWRLRKQSKPPSATVSRDKLQSAHTEAEAYTDTEANTNTRRATARKRVSQPKVTAADMEAEGVERQHALDWLTARHAKKLPLTQTAWADTKAEAAKAHLTIAQAIATAAAHGWGGFKASWMHGNGAANGTRPANRQLAVEAENQRVLGEWLGKTV